MGTKERTGRKSLRQALSSLVDKERCEGEGLIELRGRASVTVRGSGAILTYTPTVIRLGFGKEVLRIEGTALICSSYFLGAVRVDGKIGALSFEEEGR